MSANRTKVLILGTGFIFGIHLESYRRFVPEAEVVAVFSRNLQRAEAVARIHGIPQWYGDIEQAITQSGCDVVDVCLPNFLHARAALVAAREGKHVIVEKPLAMNLEEAQEMIAACKAAGRKLMYAEELCFAPKYERVRNLAQEGALGKVFQMRQSEKHSGPHSDWFYDVSLSGGGVIMDMGCHAFGWFRWMMGAVKPVSVYAHMDTIVHQCRTKGEDNSLVVVEFESGAIGVAENSWAKQGGMDDRIEVYGTEGVAYADLFMANAALTYSKKGYEYAFEKAGATQGWSFAVSEESFNQGYPHELKHFIECVRSDQTPLVTGEDGRAVLEIIMAAYESARLGQKVRLPFHPHVAKPIDLWRGV